MINNRQAGRRRGRGGNNNGGPRQGGQQGNGSRIDSRARGNATQLYEKYKNMAADAQRSGDRVTTEYYLQFADHYFRVLSEQRGRFDEQQPQRGRNDFDGNDANDFGAEDYGDEGEPIRGNEGDGGDMSPQRPQMRDDRGERPREDRQRDDRPREDRQREDRPRGDREPRRDGEGRTREGGEGRSRESNEGRRDRNEWQDRPRERRPEQATLQPAVEVAGQRRADPIAASESLESRAEEILEADRPLDAPPRRRGRPRRDAQPVTDESTGDSGGTGEGGFEADRLPPSLTVAANDEAPAEPKPRRRRARPAEDTPNAAE